jgi:hypothetical protein
MPSYTAAKVVMYCRQMRVHRDLEGFDTGFAQLDHALTSE